MMRTRRENEIVFLDAFSLLDRKLVLDQLSMTDKGNKRIKASPSHRHPETPFSY